MDIQPEVRLGLIGTSQEGHAIIDAINSIAHVSLVSMYSDSSEVPPIVGHNCHILPDWQSVLNMKNLDGVVIATTLDIRSIVAKTALESSLPILIEAPLAVAISDAIELKRLASDQLLMVNHSLLRGYGYRFIRELVRDGTLGHILAIRSYVCDKRVTPRLLQQYTNPTKITTDVNLLTLWTLGPQILAMCIDLLDCSEPDDLLARVVRSQYNSGSSVENNRNSDGKIELHLEFPKEIDVRIRLSSNTEGQKICYLAVYFEGLTLIYDGFSGVLTLYPPVLDFSLPDDSGEEIKLPKEKALVNMISLFASAIVNHTNEVENLNLGVDVVALLARCQVLFEQHVT